MELKLHNTLENGQSGFFKPIKSGSVSMYHCGPTVYTYASIGNMRSYVFADILRRTFEYFGFKVNQVINITDVGHLVGDSDIGEDKIEKSAKQNGKKIAEIINLYESAFLKDLSRLNIKTEDTHFPRASDHIQEQIDIIKLLEEKGFVYKIQDGMYFNTSKFKDYGKLGNINTSELKEGARIGINKEKQNLSDFALWKFSKPKESRLQEWPSPWGTGFPGWHIECSAMSRKYLGQPFDIHTGGIDHIPVHHNNEIAQSECAYGSPLANYWLHNEFITVEGEKMSKSLGNTFTIEDLIKRGFHPLSFRYLLLGAHYKSPLNFTWESLDGAHKTLEKIIFEFENLPSGPVHKETIDAFELFMSHDLDTPKSIALLHKAIDEKRSKKTIEKMDEILGLDIKNLKDRSVGEIPEEITDIQKERDMARNKKDWARSDELRKNIEKEGFVVEDTSSTSIIRKKLNSLIS
jgi:cysteinyl-tRNA synthetase